MTRGPVKCRGPGQALESLIPWVAVGPLNMRFNQLPDDSNEVTPETTGRQIDGANPSDGGTEAQAGDRVCPKL